MGESSSIEWTDHTFNPWWGCVKVHQGCKNCYAETWDKRHGGHHWGARNPRRFIHQGWNDIIKWNAKAEASGTRVRVFCASMADLFEDFDGPVLDQQDKRVEIPEALHSYQTLRCDGVHIHWDLKSLRRRAFDMMDRLTSIDWLILTKRPENVPAMVPSAWLIDWPKHVKIGVSPCDQETLVSHAPAILELANVGVDLFLSCEPLIGPIDFSIPKAIELEGSMVPAIPINILTLISWVIAGGESGHHARPMNPEWARSIRDQCARDHVPFFFKQWGEWAPSRNPKDPAWISEKIGKKEAGRLLDGVDHSAHPKWDVVRLESLFDRG